MNFSLLRKLAFLTNLAFLTAMTMRLYPFARGTAIASAIIVTGLVLSPLLNILTTGQVIGSRLFRGTWPARWFPWMVNAVILLLQLVLVVFFTGWLSLGNENL
ncbi:hypothetical protein [Flavihumibacter petaseus]|uniref:Uncharacterized protein n=1 Tax=Flavihumibacter petaseus NBRC 106054 TaxID=1220578 RepID=A0A0E9N1I4_9BACT|nr:hypothetical protein [Flavihumibacter petaseus]GAO43714.1 hypothetical protein FPE01S_02_08200 [Flavihumibacter petaseus NBRC 106054]